MFTCFTSNVSSEALGKHSFAGADFSGYHDPLSHLTRSSKDETEKFFQQAQFSISVRQFVGNVVDVKLCFISEHASVGRQTVNPQNIKSEPLLSFSLEKTVGHRFLMETKD